MKKGKRYWLRYGSIRNPRLEEAVREIDRSYFLPDSLKYLGDSNQVVPTCVRHGRVVSTASQPSLVVEMLDILELSGNEIVLDVGTGTGYSTALLSRMVGSGHVVSIEADVELCEIAAEKLKGFGIENVTVLNKDGYFGHSEHAPYDAIISMVAVGDFPPFWIEQLSVGGQAVTPIMVYYDYTPVVRLLKTDEETLEGKFVIDAVFIAMTQHSTPTVRGRVHGREITFKLCTDSSGQKKVEALQS